MRVLVVVASLIVGVPALAAPPEVPAGADAPAQSAATEKAARLDALFADLQTAPSLAAGKAIEHSILVEWLRSNVDSTNTLMVAAIVAMESRAFPQAIAILDRVVVQEPGYVEGWNKRATVYYYMHKYDRSLADIERTLELEPRHFGALAGLGMIMQDTGNLAGAIAAFEQAVAVNPSLENLKTAIGQLKAKLGKDI